MVRSKNKIPKGTGYRIGKKGNKIYDFLRWCSHCQLWRDKNACIRMGGKRLRCPVCHFIVRPKPRNKPKKKEVKNRALP